MPDGRTVTVKVETVVGKNTGAKKVIDDLEKEVISSQKRIETSKKATDRAILASAKATADAEGREAKRKANEFIRSLKEQETAAKRSFTSMSDMAKSAFGGGIVGGFAGSLVASFTAQLAQLPSLLKTQLDEMVKIAAERQNALKGLESLTKFLGIESGDADRAVKNLRLVRNGVIDLGDASISLRNLLSSGFNLKESIQLLEAFSDTAAFGKSAALSFGQAIKGATEGIRNGNSVLVDNVGLTKNLTQILKEAGHSEKDLMKVKDDMNVRQALFNGLIKEALPQMGDADKLTKGWTGSTSALSTAQQNLYAAIGNVIINNKQLNATIQTMTGDLNSLTVQVNDTSSGWSKAIDSMTTKFAEFVIDVRTGIARETAELKEFINLIQLAADATNIFDTERFTDPAAYSKRIADRYNQIGTFYSEAQRNEEQLRSNYYRNLSRNMGNQGPLFGPHTPPLGATLNTRGSINLSSSNPLYFGPATTTGTGTGATTGTTAGGAATKGGGRVDFRPSAMAQSIIEAAERLGISPIDLATIISYETRGTFSTKVKGGKGGNYTGLIQFGPEEAKTYGVGKRQGFSDQLLNSVVPFLQDRFAKAGRSTYGANILDLYRTINGGNPNVSPSASDGNGTIAQHVRNMVREHTPKVLARLFGGSSANVQMLDRDILEAYASSQPRIRSREDALDFIRSQTGGKSVKFGAPGVYTTGGQVSDEISDRSEQIKLGEQQITQNEKILDLYQELDDALFNLNEHTEEEIVLRKIKLGQYPGITEGQTRELLNNAKLIDQAKAKAKLDSDNQRALEEYQREQEQLFEDTARQWEDLLTDLSEGRFKSIWDQFRRNMLQQFIQPASRYLAQLFGPGFGGGFGGGSIGPMYGTPSFNPSASNGFANLSPQQLNQQIFNGGGGSGFGSFQNAGINNSGGSGGDVLGQTISQAQAAGRVFPSMLTMAGSFLPGRIGGALQGAGMGMQLGMMFGPLGSMIGTGIGALIGSGFFGLFGGDNSIKKLKEAALSTYGITVKDKSVLNSLKQLGESMFGKGQAGKNAQAVVSSDQAQIILRNYAEATNQKTTMMDRLYYGDENWSGNQYRSQFGGFRAMGGPVQRGFSYVVGERGPELFTPKSSGAISPTVGMGDQQMRVILGQLEETVYKLATRLEGMSAGQVLTLGAAENPEAIGDAVGSQLATRQDLTDQIARGSGRAF